MTHFANTQYILDYRVHDIVALELSSSPEPRTWFCNVGTSTDTGTSASILRDRSSRSSILTQVWHAEQQPRHLEPVRNPQSLGGEHTTGTSGGELAASRHDDRDVVDAGRRGTSTAMTAHTSPQNTTQGVKKTTLEYRGSAATQDMGGHTILHVVSPRVHEGVAADTNDALPERVLHHRRRRNAFKEGLVSNFLSRRDIQQQSAEHDRDGIVESVVLQQRRCWRRRAQTIATT